MLLGAWYTLTQGKRVLFLFLQAKLALPLARFSSRLLLKVSQLAHVTRKKKMFDLTSVQLPIGG